MRIRTRIAKLEREMAIVLKGVTGVQEIVITLSNRALLGNELKALNDEARKLREPTKHAERCPCRCGQTPVAIIDQNWRMAVAGCITEMLDSSGYDITGANNYAVRAEFNTDDLPTDPDEWAPMLQDALDRAAKSGALTKSLPAGPKDGDR